MKKKLFNFGIIAAFSISTIGLPFTIHFCEMMKEKSFVECAICAEKFEITSCCDEESNELRITSSASQCCQDDFTFNKIEDQFLNSKSETKQLLDHSLQVENDFTLVILTVKSASINIHDDSSPPGDEERPIYLRNASFLI